MEPAIEMALLWGLFGAAHIGLTTRLPRRLFVERFGEGAFIWVFSAIAAVSFSALVAYFALHRHQGAAGLGWAQLAWLRTIAIGAIFAGLALLAGSLVAYRNSPMAVRGAEVREPRGLARVTRHGFFVGLSLFAAAHVLLSSRLIGTVFFAGFAVVSIAGALHQDRKLLARDGRAYADYLATTSFVPFAAALSGRQYIVWAELPWKGFAVGLAIAFALRSVHGSILDYGGIWFLAAALGGAGVEIVRDGQRRRRAALATSRT